MMTSAVPTRRPTLGTDPEFFIRSSKGNRLVPSEVVLGNKSFIPRSERTFDGLDTVLVQDGVQAEIHPKSTTACRANWGVRLRGDLLKAAWLLNRHGMYLDFNTVGLEVEEDTYFGLSDESRELGCNPSLNIYTDDNSFVVPEEDLRYRSAAGHLHFGTAYYTNYDEQRGHPEAVQYTVALLDLLLGLPCVLLDQNPESRKRRQFYGKAGEYRNQPHGIEYRTLSNFWLQDYRYVSFVTGMGRAAMSLLGGDPYFSSTIEFNPRTFKYESVTVEDSKSTIVFPLLKAIKTEDVQAAINENDKQAAGELFQHVFKFLNTKIFSTDVFRSFATPVYNYTSAKTFVKEAPIVRSKLQGSNRTLLERWATLFDGHERGWESFRSSGFRVRKSFGPGKIGTSFKQFDTAFEAQEKASYLQGDFYRDSKGRFVSPVFKFLGQ